MTLEEVMRKIDVPEDGSKIEFEDIFVTALISTTDEKQEWDDAVQASGGRIHYTGVRVIDKDEALREGETRRWATGKISGRTVPKTVAFWKGGEKAKGIARQVEVLQESDGERRKKHKREATVVLRIIADKRYFGDLWKDTRDMTDVFDKWVKAMLPQKTYLKLGDVFKWRSEKGPGGGKPIMRGLIRIPLSLLAEISKIGGQPDANKSIFYFMQFEWADPMPPAFNQPCGVDWTKKAAGVEHLDHACNGAPGSGQQYRLSRLKRGRRPITNVPLAGGVRRLMIH